MKFTPAVVDLIPLAERIQAVSLPGMHLLGHRQRIGNHAIGLELIPYDAHLPSPSAWVFYWLSRVGGAELGDRVQEFRTYWLRAVERAELPDGFRMHDLRHRRITTWLADGKDVVKVKEAVGHAALATTMAYTHLVRENLRSLVDDDQDERERLKELAL